MTKALLQPWQEMNQTTRKVHHQAQAKLILINLAKECREVGEEHRREQRKTDERQQRARQKRENAEIIAFCIALTIVPGTLLLTALVVSLIAIVVR